MFQLLFFVNILTCIIAHCITLEYFVVNILTCLIAHRIELEYIFLYQTRL